MKLSQNILTLLPLCLLLLGLTSCADKVVTKYEANSPRYQSFEEWRQTEFALESARPLLRPGKIYLYNNLLIVNDFMRGLHFYENSNPANPVALGFLPVHANIDMAVRNNVLYVDSYTDLLSFNIDDIYNIQLLSRTEDVFTFTGYASLPGYKDNLPVADVDLSQGVVIEFITEDVQEVHSRGYYGHTSYLEDAFVSFDASFTNGTNSPGAVGKAGSTARFALYEDHLYTLQMSELDVYDISGTQPVAGNSIRIVGGAETLFPAQRHLFIGTQNGMLIYDLAVPSSPTFKSSYEHFFACDPVVVSGDRAYVTLSSARTCQGTLNVLEVIDISNLNQPRRIVQHEMTNPRGLGLDGSTLFLCDGPDGLKIYDRSNDLTIPDNLLATFPGIVTNDVIPFNDVLFMTSEAGIFQYDYSDLNNITQLSLIPIQN